MGKGGGGGGGPTQTTAYQTNLPEYAKPYVENMLNAAQAQIYTPDMKGFQPYKPYSTDPTDYVAGPSALQRQVYGEAGQMQTPGAFGAAQGMAGLAGLGQMGAGARFARQATDPNAIAAYMSPFMQNVVDVQKAQALRDYQKGIPALRTQAAAAGAFGGSRLAIQEAEAQRSLLSNLANIQAQGTQAAFDKAQQAQQFGANLGLQGLQGAASTAGTLGQLGGAQQQADIARMGLQQQLGQAQQQYQQQIINQAVQDYATAQQYPYMQLATMSGLLRGLPLQAMTTQQYQAAPNVTSQMLGLGATALGAYGASGGFRGAKEGGLMSAYKAGGTVKRYNTGDLVAEQTQDPVVAGITRDLMQYDAEKLREIAQTSSSPKVRQIAAQLLSQKMQAEQARQASQGIAGAQVANMDDMDTVMAAGGGIVAFAGPQGSLVKDEEEDFTPEKGSSLENVANYMKYLQSQGFGQQSPQAKQIAEQIAETRKSVEGGGDKDFWRSVMLGGAKTMAGKSQYLAENLGEGLATGIGEYGKAEQRREDLMNKLRSGEIDLAKLTQGERNYLLHYATTAATQDATARLKNRELVQRGSEAAAARRATSLDNLYKDAYGKLITNELKRRGLTFEGELSPEQLDKISEDAARRAKQAYTSLHTKDNVIKIPE